MGDIDRGWSPGRRCLTHHEVTDPTQSEHAIPAIMSKFGCRGKFITMVRQFHDGMQASLQDGDAYSEPFPVTNGVKQGCVLAPTFFSMMFSAMLTDAFRDDDIGVGIWKVV